MLVDKVLFYLWDATVKTTLLLAMVAVTAALSRRASASFRHLLWALGLGCALVLPVLSWNLPQWHVPVTVSSTRSRPVAEAAPLAQAAPPAASGSVAKAAPAEQAASAPSVVSGASAPPPPVASSPTPIPSAAAPPATPFRIPWPALVLLTWITGAFLLLVQSVRGLAAIGEVAKNSVSITQGPLADAARTAASSIQVGRGVELRQMTSVGEVTVPLTYGARRPVVVLPAEADRWPPKRLRAVLLHEMAHVKRHDWALQMLSHLAGALYWFHPLVWVSTRRMRVESEAACDDLVLGAGVPAQDYARHLLDVALSVRDIRRLRSGAVAMAQGPKVEGRLRAVLAQGLSRRPVARRAAAGVLAACLLLVVPLAALRLVAQAEGVPVPAADRLQLQGDFTLRYAVTITDLKTTQQQFREYQQLRADYQRELRKDPYFQPVPAEYYGPFSYFQSRRPKVRHLVLTVSSQHGKLLWRSEEGGETFAEVYNGRNGTQLFSNGQTGRIEPGLQFDEMTDCPLPAVGLPHVPLFKAGTATLASTSGTRQTWRALCPIEGAKMEQGKVVYLSGVAHVVSDGGTWKALDLDTGTQRFEFLEHQRFQGLWLASQMRLFTYTVDPTPANVLPPHFNTLSDADDWFNARRSATESCEYSLLSASETPLDLSAVSMHTVSAAPSGPVDVDSARTQHLEDSEVQEALHLRYHLQGWAQSHETLLRRMDSASSSDLSSASAVDQFLRALPLPLWQGGGIVWDGDPRTGHDGQKPLFTDERLRQPSGNARDFIIARSRNSGTSRVVLWASGRITRVTAGTSDQEEIAPAFFGEGGRSNMAGDETQALSDGSPMSSDNAQSKAASAAHVALGERLQSQGQPRDGIPEFRRAVQIDPNNAEAQSDLAQALYEIKWKHFRTPLRDTTVGSGTPPAVLDEAILHMRQAVALRPIDARLHSTLGSYLSDRGRHREAVAEYRRAMHLMPPLSPTDIKPSTDGSISGTVQPWYDAYRTLGEELVKTGQYQEAVMNLRQALRFSPSDDACLLWLGDALNGSGHRAEARAAWRRCLAAKPPKSYYQRQARARLARY